MHMAGRSGNKSQQLSRAIWEYLLKSKTQHPLSQFFSFSGSALETNLHIQRSKYKDGHANGHK